jgi:hypothetical protein
LSSNESISGNVKKGNGEDTICAPGLDFFLRCRYCYAECRFGPNRRCLGQRGLLSRANGVAMVTLRKAHVHRVLYEGRTVSDGKWIDLSQNDIEPPGYNGDFLMGYDSNNKEMVAFVGDNHGYAMLTGPGWQGQSVTLTMTGQASYEGFSKAKQLPISRVTYQVKSADVYTVTWEVQEAQKWNEDDFLTCKRTNP